MGRSGRITNGPVALPDRRAVRARVRNKPEWFRLANNVDAGVVDLYLFDEIGCWGTSAQDLVDQLKPIAARTINVNINSPGGECFDGLAIYNLLKAHPAQVHVMIHGLAASAASFIAQAGDKITIARNGMMMIHDASGLCWGNATDMQEMADLLDKLSANLADIYSQRAGGTAEQWREAMRAETWYTGAEAVAAGLADEMTDPDEAPPADAAPEMSNAWDLSIFRYAGREAAPAPEVRGQAPATAPAAVEPPPAPATGGIVTGLAIVGEHGPEVVDLPDGAQVVAAQEPPDECDGAPADGDDQADGAPAPADETVEHPPAAADDWTATVAALTAGPDDLWAALTSRITHDTGASTVDDPFARLREALA